MYVTEKSDDSTNSSSSITRNDDTEPLNWYITNREWHMGHVSQGTNPSLHSYKNENVDKPKSEKPSSLNKSLKIVKVKSDGKIQECSKLLKKQCRFDDAKKNKLIKCFTCCYKKGSETNLIKDESSESQGDEIKMLTKKPIEKTKGRDKLSEVSVQDKKLPTGDKKIAEIRNKEIAKVGDKIGMKDERKTKSTRRRSEERKWEISEFETAGASADITKSCCYLCAQNSLAIFAAGSSEPERQTRGTQVSEKPRVRTVQSSVRVKTCDRSTDCRRTNESITRAKFKFKKFKVLKNYMKNVWPMEKTVACGTDPPMRKRTKGNCCMKHCRRSDLPCSS